MFHSRCIKHPLCHYCHFVHVTIGWRWGRWGKMLTSIHRMGYPIDLIFKILPCLGHLLVSIHVEHNYLHFFFFFQFGEVYPHTSSSNLFFHYFSNHVPFRSLTIQSNQWLNIIIRLAISPSKVHDQVHYRKFWPLGRRPFTTVFQGCLREGL